MAMPFRSPPSRSVEELHGCIIVWDQDGQALAYVYYEDNPAKRAIAKLLTREKARQVAANIAKLPADAAPEAALAICERVAEVQAQAILTEPELLRAMFDVGYYPPNTPPQA
jgi:hypothetical protein